MSNNNDNYDLVADKLKAEGKVRKNKSTRKINNLWLWFGVLILVAILLWWLFSMGVLGDGFGAFNGN